MTNLLIHDSLKSHLKENFPELSLRIDNCNTRQEIIQTLVDGDGIDTSNVLRFKPAEVKNDNFMLSLLGIYNDLILSKEMVEDKYKTLQKRSTRSDNLINIFTNTLKKNKSSNLLIDHKHQKIMINNKFQDLLGITDDELIEIKADFNINLFLEKALAISKTPELLLSVFNDITMGDIDDLEFEIEGLSCRWYHCHTINHFDADDKQIVGRIWSVTDISDEKNYYFKLEQQYNFDALTNLPNKNYLKKRVTTLLENNSTFSMGLFNLRNFRYINESLGYQVGDEVLLYIMETLKEILNDDVLLGRNNADEFFFLVEGDNSIIDIQNYTKDLILRFENSFIIKDTHLFLSANIGITDHFVLNDDIIFDNIFKQANIALNRAKDKGDNEQSIFDESMLYQSQEYLNMRHKLSYALEYEEFEIHFQPKINNYTDKPAGVEALIRWRKDGELIPPSRFIPISESSGFIIPMTEWIIDDVCKTINEWKHWLPVNSDGNYDFHVAINISALHFEKNNLVDLIDNTLKKYNLPSHVLELEITESSFINNKDKVLKTLFRLKELGVRIAIDDFGTGYSSLSYLKDMPIDILKIDQSFIKQCEDSSTSRDFVRAIIEMAHIFNVEVVAEGVESLFMYELLKTFRCDYTQGFYLGRPQSKQEFFSDLQQIYSYESLNNGKNKNG